MSENGSKFWRVILILIFGGAMTALGVQEIHDRYGGETIAQRDVNDTMVRDLYGASVLARARMSPEAIEKIKRDRESQSAPNWIIETKDWLLALFSDYSA